MRTSQLTQRPSIANAVSRIQQRGGLNLEDSVLRFEWGTTVASVPIMVH